MLLSASLSSAQEAPTTGSLELFQPSVPVDAFLGVPSPAIGGHLVPRVSVFTSYAREPLSIEDGDERHVIVSDQLFLHAAASLALFDRVLISADMAFAVFQNGESPTIAGYEFPSPTKPEVGDLRLGARFRLFGEYWDPFQMSVGGYVFAPTSQAGSYAGDGKVSGEPHLLIGGRADYFVYSASLGTMLRASARPHSFDARAGAALVLGESVFQIGPEIAVSVPFKKDIVLDTVDTAIAVASPASAELLLAAKLRVLGSLVFGAGGGPGLSRGWGTPVALAVGTVGYDPLPPKETDTDTDGDGILDQEDACRTVPGVRSDDPKKNGCPPDGDDDGIVDTEDACPSVPGPHSDDPKKNGCPDTDGDGVLDKDDACPKVPGVRSDDPKKNGCPNVEVTKTEIVIRRQVQFKFGKSTLDQTVDPVSDDLLAEVHEKIVEHPEIKLIEVQGHTDNIGPDNYNLTLSQARANAVRDWLVQRGIPKDKLVAKGYGSKSPRAPNETMDGRQENRRVQLLILK